MDIIEKLFQAQSFNKYEPRITQQVIREMFDIDAERKEKQKTVKKYIPAPINFRELAFEIKQICAEHKIFYSQSVFNKINIDVIPEFYDAFSYSSSEFLIEITDVPAMETDIEVIKRLQGVVRREYKRWKNDQSD